jgi:hypothetical protein
LLPARRERPRNGRATERGYELPPANADCHLPYRQWDRVGWQNITLGIVGLARRSDSCNAAIQSL